MAQGEERILGKDEVTGSNPVVGSLPERTGLRFTCDDVRSRFIKGKESGIVFRGRNKFFKSSYLLSKEE